MKKKLLIVSLLTASTMLIAGNYSRSNNIVYDLDRGLQWQDQPYTSAEQNAYNTTSAANQTGKAQKWINAGAICSSLNLDGDGWRLPTINELDTIVDTSRQNPAIDPIFQNAIGLGYWSGTTYPETTSQAWGIGFYSGAWHHCNKDGKIKFIRCVREGGGGTTPPPPSDDPVVEGNTPPTADAGPDKTVQVNHPITISGSSNDSDGAIVSYLWTKKSNGYVLANTEIFDFTPTGTNTKTLVFTVTDDEGAKASDEMVLTVTVDPIVGDNTPPTADAGPDKTVQVNNTVTISGSGSDSDGTIVAYEWIKQSTGQLLATTPTFDFTPTGTRTKTLVLTVTDDDGATASDEMILTVTDGPVGNTPPTADAGPDKTVQVNNTVTISGSGSDSDGTIVAYEWTKQSTGQLLATTSTFDFTPTGTRTKTLVLTVTDDDGATASDEMILTVTGN